ncbi:DNA primase [Nitrosomonas sp. Nm132]|uniref:DNA primase n=1 Tax=Nitrosomonas sp. Nm132 TaxID=1881053 RepID=UPI00087EB79B|nr:DNA primase [Nitrosomonas sp. Nm132]SDI03375.1 DNA primase [Nitrosomonas sp. Nm132]
MIPQSFIQELLNRIDITDVVERYVPLKKVGGNFSACCPFHNEKTPSFTVSPIKQFYHCFGCGKHGNAINFLIEYNGISFIDAVENLAAYAGLQVPARQVATYSRVSESRLSHAKKEDEQDKAGESVQHMVESMNIAAQYYRRQLKNANHAIAYLKKRGLTGEIAARFGIGYAPASGKNLTSVFSDYSLNRSENVLIKVGLVIPSEDGKHYDRFRDRIMFPILDQKGRIIGFGGRVLDSGEPKYLNSPETPLFTKGRELYNLFAASKAIRKSGRALVVEGYMDVVVLAQYGVDYAIATLGTATTSFHIQKLLRQTDEIIFCFDGDSAGRKAAWRALENSLAQLKDGKNISFLFLPENEDPDSYIRKFGKESFEALLDQALPLSEFFYSELSARVNLQTSEGRAGLVQHTRPLLAQISAPVLALMLIKRLSQLTSINQNELEGLLQFKQKASFSQTNLEMKRPQPATPYRKLIQIMLHDPAYAGKLDKNMLIGHGEQNNEKKLLIALIDFFNTFSPQALKDAVFSSVKGYFYDSPYYELLEKIEEEMSMWKEGMDIEAEFTGVLLRLREMQRKQRMAALHSKPLNLLTVEEKRELQQLSVS